MMIQFSFINHSKYFVAPLVYINPEAKKRTAILVGINSWAAACGYAEWPDVFGRVSHVVDWVTEKTGQNKMEISFQINKDFNLFSFQIGLTHETHINKEETTTCD